MSEELQHILFALAGFLMSYVLQRKDRVADLIGSQVENLIKSDAQKESRLDAAWRSIEEIKSFNSIEIKEMRQDIRMILEKLSHLEATVDHINK